MKFDITWHDAKEEMPGTFYDYKNESFDKFITRFYWGEDVGDCLYKTARLINGEFSIDFNLYDYEDATLESLHEDLTITHWAMINHSLDYD